MNDYEIIARAVDRLRDVIPATEGGVLRGVDLTVVCIAHALADAHPRFDRAGFVAACGYRSPEDRYLDERGWGDGDE